MTTSTSTTATSPATAVKAARRLRVTGVACSGSSAMKPRVARALPAPAVLGGATDRGLLVAAGDELHGGGDRGVHVEAQVASLLDQHDDLDRGRVVQALLLA